MSPVKYSVTVEGMAELRAAFRKLGGDMEEFRQVNAQVAGWVGPQAAQAAPRQSGMLAASWRPSGTIAAATIRFGGAAVPYANAVHWGTGPRPGRRGPHNIAPNPFAVRTVHATEAQWSSYYEDFVDRVIKEAGF